MPQNAIQKQKVLLLIVMSQFFCTSLWFAGNGVLDNLISDFSLNNSALGHLTSAVQFGFITGTLVFAIFTIADRFSPSRVFFTSALIAGCFNLGMLWEGNTLFTLLLSRFLTGFFLAGIYPVGMKIAADYFEEGLGRSLSFLVGALVLGTALPHLLKENFQFTEWTYVILSTSALAVAGGTIVMAGIPDGPFRKAGKGFKWDAVFTVFRNRELKVAALGYFGHMWELYAFWAFVPVIFLTYQDIHHVALPTSAWSFGVIAIGSLGCLAGGLISERAGVKKTAFISLMISCSCCLLSPVILIQPSTGLLAAFLLLWGMAVIADSPLFSTMVARNADGPLKGSALTLVNCIGFGITIFSIQLLTLLQDILPSVFLYPILALGPLIGLLALRNTA